MQASAKFNSAPTALKNFILLMFFRDDIIVNKSRGMSMKFDTTRTSTLEDIIKYTLLPKYIEYYKQNKLPMPDLPTILIPLLLDPRRSKVPRLLQ